MSTSRWGDRLVRYPPDLARRYRQAGLWGTRTIADELHAVATAYPQREAVVALDGRMTYRELDEGTDVLAAGLAGLGLVPGDPVLFQVTNRLGAILAWYGVLKAGLVPVCALAAHRGHEIGEISRRTGAVAHLVEAGTRGFDLVGFAAGQRRDHPTLRHTLVLGATGDTAMDTGEVAIESLGADADPRAARTIVADIQRGIDPDDVAVFQLSGGTTGVPKVIPRLHAEYWYNAAAYARSWDWSPDTRVAHLIPVIHNAGIVCAVHGPHSAGGCLVLGTPDLAGSLPLMAREGVTHVLLGWCTANRSPWPTSGSTSCSCRWPSSSGPNALSISPRSLSPRSGRWTRNSCRPTSRRRSPPNVPPPGNQRQLYDRGHDQLITGLAQEAGRCHHRPPGT